MEPFTGEFTFKTNSVSYLFIYRSRAREIKLSIFVIDLMMTMFTESARASADSSAPNPLDRLRPRVAVCGAPAGEDGRQCPMRTLVS